MTETKFVVIISANIEWQAIQTIFPEVEIQSSSLGQWFEIKLEVRGRAQPILLFHGGWGKIAAASSAQYVIDRWSPALLVNLGMCGGFAEVQKQKKEPQLDDEAPYISYCDAD